MTDTLVEAPKVTVGFTRKVNLGNYESAEASIFIQVPTALGDTSEQIVENAKLAFADGKATVYEQLGIVMDVVEGVVVEKFRQQLGGVVEVSGAPQAVAAAPTASVQQTSNSSSVPTTKAEAAADLVANPKGWFDNRKTKTGKQPDFKRKGSAAPGEKYPPSLWLSDLKTEGVEAPDAGLF